MTQRPPVITSPLSLDLLVSDLAQSTAFYSGVLGFDVHVSSEQRGAEAVLGPARIQLRAPDTPHQTPKPSILFFETDDIGALHTLVAQQGGAPSDLARVNWIKMEMFEIRDPDGHTLWFGQSFHEPNAEHPQPMMRKIMPDLPLSDVAAGVAHYRDVLGFSVNYAQHDLAVMDRDDVRIVLVARTGQHRGIGSCYVYVRNADALHAELVAAGANVQGDPASHPWGLRDFYVADLEGNRIGFGQPFE
jgi:catechol 2,3-dioxygenase-like lactoylglutathione lyase family enzyme